MVGGNLRWLFGALLVGILSQGCLANDTSSERSLLGDSHPPSGLEVVLRKLISAIDGYQQDALCTVCVDAATILREAYASGTHKFVIEQFVILICSDLHLFPHDVCDGMVKLEAENVLYILNATQYDLETVCGIMLQGHCDKRELSPWTLPIPGGKPLPDDPEPVLPAANTLRILHITDSHTDLQYDEGSAVDCGYPMCCRFKYGEPQPGEPAAGHWGAENNCDIPLRTLDELIHQGSLLKPDLVYLTGDMPAHDVWEQTKAKNVESMNATLSLVRKHMPDTPVFNCLGNHEGAPVNSFPVPAVYGDGFNMDWLYEAAVALWSPWVPEETHDDILRGGYFSHSPFPGFRIVSINMNYCDVENWWLLIDSVDPTGQLQWLIDTLGAAEAAGEKVHILAHFPPGGSCVDSFNKLLNEVITRYESTIRAMFHGHTHKEAFTVVYDPQDTLRPVAVGFTGPEGSCRDRHQPAFKMYTIDANHEQATWSVIDMQTFTMNMTLANQPGGTPEFVQRYTSQETYKVQTLTAGSVDQLTLNMAADKDLFAQYVRNKHNYDLEPAEMFTCPEDPACHKSELCGIVNTHHDISDACHRIEAIIDGGYY
ncbi:sphingomyelin phosphodiesterase-like [Macrobrachium nipponense]|uniref:sphingomyelin phosphodiesterase-like n=1 Tax=Macrobrachium nipponense TaxID=159736 RepID=UPI0030C84936